MIKLTLAQIQSVAAPVLLPVTPSILMGSEIYTSLLPKTGWVLAGLAAVGGATGAEFVIGATCYAAVKMYRRQNWAGFSLALALVVASVAAMIIAILYVEETKARFIVVFSAMTPIGYLAYSLIQDMREEDQWTTENAQLEIERMNAQKNLLHAERRKMEREQFFSLTASVRGANEQGEQSEQVQDSKRTEVFALLDSEGELPVREVARRVGCSPSTASKHVGAWKERKG